MRKSISLVLSILMVITILPLNVINAEGENSVNIVAEGDVAKVYKEIFNQYSRYDKSYKNLTDEGNALAKLKGPLIKGDVIKAEDMKYLKVFSILDKDVNDELMAPLEFADNLEEFKVTQNDKSLKREVLDFSFIKNCKNLKVFYYQNQDINGKTENVQKQFAETLFSPLKSLKNIKDIRINSVELKNLNSFKDLDLETLSLQENDINDIIAINDINISDRLDLDNNNISDISSLSHLNELVTLYLLGNPIEDISALPNLRKLEALHLRGTKVKDISPLKNLSNLHRLYIDKCEDLKSDYMSVVKELSGINTLYLPKINLGDFEWLKKFAIRGAVDAKYGEDKVRIFNFDELQIELEANPEEVIDGKFIFDNPIRDWDNYAVISAEEISNPNVEFKDDKIAVKLSNDNYEFSYPVYIENYEYTFGDYGQPATISGNVKIIISVKEETKEPLTIIVKKGNDVFTESLTLEIFDGDNLVETVEPNQGMGAVTKYEVGKTYTVKLKDNDKYELVTGFMKVVEADGMVGAHFLESEDEEATDDNGIVVKIKDKEVEPEQPKDPLQVMVMKDNMPILEGLTLEFMDGDNIVDTVSVANSQAAITKYEVGKTYTLRLKDNDKYEVLTKFMKVVEESGMVLPHFLETTDEEPSMDNLGTLKLKDKESSEPSEPEEPTVETLDELTIKVKVDDEFKEGIQLRVNLWDELNIPTISSQPKTDSNGEVVLKELKANVKYSITVGSRGYTFNPDTIEVLTDVDGKIKTVNGKAATEYKDGLVIEGHSKVTEPTTTVNVPIKTVDKETGKPVAGVEITANIINPLSSFKNFTSDEEGNVNLELEGTQEGRVYALTISKNDQFNWDFEPELIEVIVLEDSYQILKSKGNENSENIFRVTKNDRNHLRNDLKELIEKAEALIASGKYTNESLAGLKEAVQGGKAELAKDETIPYYVEGHIDKINKAIEKLVLIDQPEQPDQPEEPEKPVEPTPQPTPEPEYNPGHRFEPSPDYLRDYSRRDEKPVERKEEVKEEKKEEVKAKQEEKQENAIQETVKPISVMAPSLPVTLTDIPAGESGNAINNMVARGVLKGTGEDKFEPETTITRAMVTEVFMRISTDQNIDSTLEFTDVKANDWYNNSVKWAASKNIIKGFEDGSFKPGQKVTAQEFAVMVERMFTEYNINLPFIKIIDTSKYQNLQDWSKEAVIKILSQGLISESDEPIENREITRAELAKALDMIIKFIEAN